MLPAVKAPTRRVQDRAPGSHRPEGGHTSWKVLWKDPYPHPRPPPPMPEVQTSHKEQQKAGLEEEAGVSLQSASNPH